MPFAPTPCIDCAKPAVYRGRCEVHRKPAWSGSTRGERLPDDWRTRRLIVLKRDKAVCWVCGGADADEVDHKTPGDDHSLGNLAPIHQQVAPHCHRFKSAAEGVAARAANSKRRPKARPLYERQSSNLHP